VPLISSFFVPHLLLLLSVIVPKSDIGQLYEQQQSSNRLFKDGDDSTLFLVFKFVFELEINFCVQISFDRN
jgi:hypothetical protein